MKIKNIKQIIRGWFPTEPKVSNNWSKNKTIITISVLISFSLIVIFIINSSIMVFVGAYHVLWTQNYEGLEAGDVVETSDRGIVFVLHSLGSYQLVNTDESGNLVWNQTYSGTGRRSTSSLIECLDGGLILASRSENNFDDGYHYHWLTKLDNSGNMVWNQTYRSNELREVITVVEVSDGGFALGGQIFPLETNNTLLDSDFWLAKVDKSGNMLWNKTYGGAHGDVCLSLIETSDGGFALAGHTASFGKIFDYWLVKTDRFGNMLWNQTYGEEIHRQPAQQVIETSEGGFVLASTTMQLDGNMDFWFAKTDKNGNLVWKKTYGEENRERLISLVSLSDGGFVLVGNIYEGENEEDDFRNNNFGKGWLVKIDESGNMVWNQTYSDTSFSVGSNTLIGTSDRGYVLLGNKNLTDKTNEVWVAKIEEEPKLR